MATVQSAFSACAASSARSDTETGVCITASANTPAASDRCSTPNRWPPSRRGQVAMDGGCHHHAESGGAATTPVYRVRYLTLRAITSVLETKSRKSTRDENRLAHCGLEGSDLAQMAFEFCFSHSAYQVFPTMQQFASE